MWAHGIPSFSSNPYTIIYLFYLFFFKKIILTFNLKYILNKKYTNWYNSGINLS